MRLIDADEMLRRLEAWNTSDNMDKALYTFTFMRIIEQPTAYDVDKVVEQLSEIEVYRGEYSEIVECNIEPCDGMSCYECIVNKSIEIVKKGGAE